VFRLTSLLSLFLAANILMASDLAVTGEIVAAKAQDIVTPRGTGWQIQIKWLKEEGVTVRPGEVVAIFDGSSLETEVEQKKSSLEQKQQERVNQQLQGEQNILNAKLELETARINLKKALLDSEQPKSLINALDYQKFQLATKKALLAVDAAELKLEKTTEAANKKLAQIDLETEDLQRELVVAESRLSKMEIVATLEGPIVYTSDRHGNKIKIGDDSRFGEKVATIPQMDQLQVEALVADVDIHKIVIGQSVALQLDANPEKTYSGKVIAINSSGETKKPWGDAKYYPIRIEFNQLPKIRLVAGMSVLGVIQL